MLQISSLDVTYFFIACLWLLSAIVDHAQYCYYLQLKEYRFDRWKDFLRTREGHAFLLQPTMVWRSILVLTAFTLFYDTKWASFVVLGILCLDVGYGFYKALVLKKLRYPTPTPKALLIVLTSIVLEASILFFAQKINVLLLILVFRFFITIGVVLLFHVGTKAIKYWYIYTATKKLAKYPNLTVVGITGSYGKSSVKEFVAHLATGTFQVVKTPGNVNTDIGVAKFIHSHDFSNDGVFICEMGAYRIGEIARICEMVRPTIGVLTAINEQHLSLFGSIRHIQQAKYELLRSIPVQGAVITNADNPYCMEFISELVCKNIHTFGTEEDLDPRGLFTDIHPHEQGTDFTITIEKNEYRVTTPVIGAHHAYNVGASILIAHALGISLDTCIERCKTLPVDTHGSLHLYPYGNAIIIDDSYNSNPQGFRAALDVFHKYPSEKRRIVITRGMVELGDKSDELHEQIGGEIAFVADELVVITPDSVDALTRGVGTKYHTDIHTMYDHSELLSYIQAQRDNNVVLLLENRMPGIVGKELAPYRDMNRSEPHS